MDNQEFKIQLIRRSKKFSLDIWKFLDNLPNVSFSLNIISRQLLRSATSIGANIIEAQASSSKKDFINFLHHALKSANETAYWLELLFESGKADNLNIENLLKESRELANILGSIILKLKGRK